MLPGARGKARAGALVSLGLAAGLGCADLPAEQLGTNESSIVGGELDTTSRAIVSLLTRVEGGFFPSCTGTLIAPNLILTAHHCVADLNSSDGQSVDCASTTFDPPHPASSLIVSLEANVGQEGLDPYQVAQVWLPPGAGNLLCGKDIALLRLSRSVPANVAQPIVPRLDDEVSANEQFAAIGYGLQDPNDERGETIGHRMRVNDAMVFCTGASCGADFVTQDEWIGESPVCSGDSGGPALDGEGRVAGVTSRGDPQCTLGIYTSVHAWRDFISRGAHDAAASGGYSPPTWAGEPPDGVPLPSGGSGGGGSDGGGSGGGGSGGSASVAGTGPIVVGGSTASAPVAPTVDALGLACSDRCPGTFACWSASGKPPGVCVPRCGAAPNACPASYTCQEDTDTCVPSQAIKRSGPKQSSSCSIDARPASGGPSYLALLGLLVLLRRRRTPRPQGHRMASP
jgi:hypothetical protein